MPFLTQGKTNWKFIAIVAVLAIIAGAGILIYQYFGEQKIEEPDLIELKEENKEEIDIEKIARELNCIWSQNPDNCHSFLETLFKYTISSDIIVSDEKLEEYFNKNLDHLFFEGISRGKFDKYLNQETIIISFLFEEPHFPKNFNRYAIIIQKTDGEWQSWYQNIGYHEKFFNEPLKLIKNEPEFFLGESKRIGIQVPGKDTAKIYRLEDRVFKSIWEIVNFLEHELEWGKFEITDTTIDFKDLNDDGNLEIIQYGTKKLCRGIGYICEEVIGEEEIYQAFKWNPQKQNFIEFEI